MAKPRNINDLEDSVERANTLGVLGGKSTPVQSSQPATLPETSSSLPAKITPVVALAPTTPSNTSSQEEEAVPKLTKCTFYLSDEDVLAIDEMQSDEFRRTRRRPDRSLLVRQAIQHFYTSRKNQAD